MLFLDISASIPKESWPGEKFSPTYHSPPTFMPCFEIRHGFLFALGEKIPSSKTKKSWESIKKKSDWNCFCQVAMEGWGTGAHSFHALSLAVWRPDKSWVFLEKKCDFLPKAQGGFCGFKLMWKLKRINKMVKIHKTVPSMSECQPASVTFPPLLPLSEAPIASDCLQVTSTEMWKEYP